LADIGDGTRLRRAWRGAARREIVREPLQGGLPGRRRDDRDPPIFSEKSEIS
jgi:hypothetical protein